jgi:hypothetical protein
MSVMGDWKTIYTVQTWVTPALIKVEFQFEFNWYLNCL